MWERQKHAACIKVRVRVRQEENSGRNDGREMDDSWGRGRQVAPTERRVYWRRWRLVIPQTLFSSDMLPS